MISGPMPSPGKTAMFILEIPGELRFAPRLEGADLVGVAQRQADLVETVEDAMLAERIDVETEALRAVAGRDRLLFQIDDQFEPRKRRRLVEKPVDLGLGERDRQEAVLEGVVLEDLAERRRDHRA